MNEEVEEFSGILKGVELSKGPKKDGTPWERASIKIEAGDKFKTLGTFDSEDIKSANMANGKQVTVKYTTKGKYSNLEKGGITVTGQGEAPLGKEAEETVEDKPKDQMSKGTTSYQTKEGYWADKGKWEQEVNSPRIIRQNSWTQAQKYIENMLKAADLQVIKLTKDDLKFENILELAHKIEEDITR